MRFVYSRKKDDSIIKQEIKLIESHLKAINDYVKLFEQCNCTIEVKQGWENPVGKNIVQKRPLFKNGYKCLVYCTVQKDGKPVRYNNHDGEVDYYELSMSWIVTQISQFFVDLYDNTDEIIQYMNHFLEILEAKDVEFIL